MRGKVRAAACVVLKAKCLPSFTEAISLPKA